MVSSKLLIQVVRQPVNVGDWSVACVHFGTSVKLISALWTRLSNKHKRKPKQKGSYREWAIICFYSILPHWSVHSFPLYFIFLDCFIVTQTLSLSLTQDYLVIDDLVIECPRRRTILLIACLLKDMSLQIHLVSGSQLHINALICSSPFSDWWWLLCFGVKCLTKDLLSWRNLFHIKTVIQKFYLNYHHFSFYKPYSCHFCSFPWTL